MPIGRKTKGYQEFDSITDGESVGTKARKEEFELIAKSIGFDWSLKSWIDEEWVENEVGRNHDQRGANLIA